MRLIISGVPRSGSTLFFHLLRAVCPGELIGRTHPGWFDPFADRPQRVKGMDGNEIETVNDGKEIIFTTLRSPFDTAASRWRLRGLSPAGKSLLNPVGLETELRVMRDQINGIDRLDYPRHPHWHLIKYEDFFGNYDVVFNLFESVLGIIILPTDRMAMKAEYSFKKNLERCTGGDKIIMNQYQLGYKHLGVGTPGTWRSIIPAWGHDLMEKYCRPIAERWGYK